MNIVMRRSLSFCVAFMIPFTVSFAGGAGKSQWLSLPHLKVHAVPVIPGNGTCMPVEISFMADSVSPLPEIVRIETVLTCKSGLENIA